MAWGWGRGQPTVSRVHKVYVKWRLAAVGALDRISCRERGWWSGGGTLGTEVVKGIKVIDHDVVQ